MSRPVWRSIDSVAKVYETHRFRSGTLTGPKRDRTNVDVMTDILLMGMALGLFGVLFVLLKGLDRL